MSQAGRASDVPVTQGKEVPPSLQPVPPPYTSGAPRRDFRLRTDEDIDGAWPTPAGMRTVFVDSKWRKVLESFHIQLLGGFARDRYVRWYLEPKFFLSIDPPDHLKPLIREGLTRTAHPLYVEASDGGPWGDYLMNMLKENDRVESIYIQRYGYPNRVMCECCERRYKESDGTTRKRGLWPYPECYSVPGFAGGACGNCVYSIKGTKCTWYTDNPALNWLKASTKTAQLSPIVRPDTCEILHRISSRKMLELTEERTQGEEGRDPDHRE